MSDLDRLRLRLKNSLLASGTSPQRFAYDAGTYPQAIMGFLSGASKPHLRTVQRIEEELGRMSRKAEPFGFFIPSPSL